MNNSNGRIFVLIFPSSKSYQGTTHFVFNREREKKSCGVSTASQSTDGEWQLHSNHGRETRLFSYLSKMTHLRGKHRKSFFFVQFYWLPILSIENAKQRETEESKKFYFFVFTHFFHLLFLRSFHWNSTKEKSQQRNHKWINNEK